MQTHQGHSGSGDNVVYKFIINGIENQITVPRLLNLVPVPPIDFIGRNEEVAAIRKYLEDGHNPVIINGVGGIGKTSVALKYLSEFETSYSHIAWLTVTDTLNEAIVTDRQLASSLNMSKDLAALPSKQLYKEGIKVIFHAVAKLSNCLLIIDNYNNLDDLLGIKGLLKSCRAHVLITSRNDPPGWQCVVVESLPLNEARKLFRNYYHFEQPSDDELDELLNELACHTLLVELSAKAAQSSRISFCDLLQRLREGYIYDISLNARAVDTGQSGQSVESRLKSAKIEIYIKLIFSEISNLTLQETQHLRVFTLLLPAEWHPEKKIEFAFRLLEGTDSTILNFFKNIVFRWFRNAKSNLHFRPNILEALVNKGWLQRSSDTSQPLSYKIHPLIQEVSVRQFKVTEEWAAPVIQYIAEGINYNNNDPKHNLFEKVKEKLHAEYIEKRFQFGKTEQYSYLIDRIAFLEESFGNYLRAQSLGERALAINEALFIPGHHKIAIRQNNLANVYEHLGKYSKARDLLEKAIESNIKNFGPDHDSVDRGRSNLGNVYQQMGKYILSKDLLEDSLTSALKKYGADHPVVALRQSNLAIIYGFLKDYNRSLELLQTALKSDLKNFSENDPKIANRYHSIGHVFLEKRNYIEALKFFEKSLHIMLLNFESSHPNVVIIVKSIMEVKKKIARSKRR